ncbi:MAG: hypothetical protein H7A01_03260 [Hahellaceae bacterium]|nr:hypothetical protein [Hahellaceae bacterium]MCP5212337.1 hypothetical protein [Hahellaceae bacterium]
MPIANCIITEGCPEGIGNIVELWAKESGVSSEHMTINFVTSSGQFGHKYKVMASLALPSVWSAQDVSLLQISLAKSLASYFLIDVSEVHVITTVVSSGLVIESGQEITW